MLNFASYEIFLAKFVFGVLQHWVAVVTESSEGNRDFKIQRRGRQRERQKSKRFNKQNNNFARASHFFVHFFPVFARLRRENGLISRFIEDVNKQRRDFISLSELEYGPLKFSFRMVRLHLTK